jgi:hypothetical protein
MGRRQILESERQLPTSLRFVLAPFGIVWRSACSAKLNGHDPYRYLKDVLERLPTHPASRIDEFLRHRWQPPASDV